MNTRCHFIKIGACSFLFCASGLLCCSALANVPLYSETRYLQPTAQKKSTKASLPWSQWALQGKNMSASTAQELEKHSEQDANALASHVMLASYYFFMRTQEDQEKKTKHIVWIIQHYPSIEILQTVICMPLDGLEPENANAVCQAWQEQMIKSPNQASVFANAGCYWRVLGRKDAIDLMSKAHRLEPENPQWLMLLGQFYAGEIDSDEEQRINRQFALKACEAYALALKLTHDMEGRISVLTDLVPLELEAENLDDTQHYAALLLNLAHQHPDKSLYGLAILTYNTALGRLALNKKHIEQAKEYLLASADIKTALSDLIIPDMSLARDLLKSGQREAVIEFLTKCKRFCKRPEIDDWISEVERGLTPHFEKSILR